MSKIILLRWIILLIMGFLLFEGTNYALHLLERRRLRIRKKKDNKKETLTKAEILIIYGFALAIYLGIIFLLIRLKIRGAI